MKLRGINHVVLKVRDLQRSAEFYSYILGFEQVGQRRRMLFFRGGGHPHDLALFEIGPDAAPLQPHQVGLFHFCITVEDETALAELYRRCKKACVKILGVVDHIVSHSFYVEDPDGNVVELTVDAPEEEWAHLENPFERDRPYHLPD